MAETSGTFGIKLQAPGVTLQLRDCPSDATSESLSATSESSKDATVQVTLHVLLNLPVIRYCPSDATVHKTL